MNLSKLLWIFIKYLLAYSLLPLLVFGVLAFFFLLPELIGLVLMVLTLTTIIGLSLFLCANLSFDLFGKFFNLEEDKLEKIIWRLKE